MGSSDKCRRGKSPTWLVLMAGWRDGGEVRDGNGTRRGWPTIRAHHSLARTHTLRVVVARKSVIINNPSSLSYHCFTLLIVVIDQVSCFFLIPFLTSLLSFKSRSGYRLFHSLLSPSLIYHNHCKQSPVPTANMRFSYAVVALIGAANAMVCYPLLQIHSYVHQTISISSC